MRFIIVALTLLISSQAYAACVQPVGRFAGNLNFFSPEPDGSGVFEFYTGTISMSFNANGSVSKTGSNRYRQKQLVIPNTPSVNEFAVEIKAIGTTQHTFNLTRCDGQAEVLIYPITSGTIAATPSGSYRMFYTVTANGTKMQLVDSTLVGAGGGTILFGEGILEKI